MRNAGSQSAWTDSLLVYAHIGDLHIVDRAMQNYRDFLSIVADIEAIGKGAIDFVFLPGDNADNGRHEQYALVATGLRMLSVPVHAITGDHDMEGGSIQPLYSGLKSQALPHIQSIRGVDCVFLDMSGEGGGGPDFRLPTRQTDFLETSIARARDQERILAVFMHTYPADLVEPEEQATVNALLADPAIRLVDMGHTHYNELANDGRTIFAATRSTGQIEEGPVGYSITTIDAGVVSWRFKPLDDPDPFVLITAPADRRLRIEGAAKTHRFIHALVLGASPVEQCEWRADDGPWQPMALTPDGRGFEALADGIIQARIEVRATDATGNIGSDAIDVAQGDSRNFARDGSDRDVIEAWPERHLLGTQLGPNRNGKKW